MQFVPQGWRDAAVPNRDRGGVKYALYHGGFSGKPKASPEGMAAYLADMADFVKLRAIDRVFVTVQDASAVYKAWPAPEGAAPGWRYARFQRLLAGFMDALPEGTEVVAQAYISSKDAGWAWKPEMHGGPTCASGTSTAPPAGGCPVCVESEDKYCKSGYKDWPPACPNFTAQVAAFVQGANDLRENTSDAAARFTSIVFDVEIIHLARRRAIGHEPPHVRRRVRVEAGRPQVHVPHRRERRADTPASHVDGSRTAAATHQYDRRRCRPTAHFANPLRRASRDVPSSRRKSTFPPGAYSGRLRLATSRARPICCWREIPVSCTESTTTTGRA